jgi:hypothetical protein
MISHTIFVQSDILLWSYVVLFSFNLYYTVMIHWDDAVDDNVSTRGQIVWNMFLYCHVQNDSEVTTLLSNGSDHNVKLPTHLHIILRSNVHDDISMSTP